MSGNEQWGKGGELCEEEGGQRGVTSLCHHSLSGGFPPERCVFPQCAYISTASLCVDMSELLSFAFPVQWLCI